MAIKGKEDNITKKIFMKRKDDVALTKVEIKKNKENDAKETIRRNEK